MTSHAVFRRSLQLARVPAYVEQIALLYEGTTPLKVSISETKAYLEHFLKLVSAYCYWQITVLLGCIY